MLEKWIRNNPHAASEINAYAQLEKIREAGWVFSIVAFPFFNYSHEHFHVRAWHRDDTLDRRMGIGVTLAAAVGDLITKLPWDLCNALSEQEGVIALPNPIIRSEIFNHVPR